MMPCQPNQQHEDSLERVCDGEHVEGGLAEYGKAHPLESLVSQFSQSELAVCINQQYATWQE
jgi:hypothetical protein